MASRDKRFNNFGIVRDTGTLEWMGATPAYDTGGSFLGDVPMEWLEPLIMPRFKPFCRTFDEELHLVNDTNWIDFDALEDSSTPSEESFS